MIHLFSQRTALTCLMFFLTLVSGCVATSGNFAYLKSDDQVKKTFENFTVLPEYTYYYYGTDSFPNAFVGISKAFTMDSSLWNPVDLTSETLHSWIWMHANRKTGNLDRYGSNIVGPNGEHIGVWYSLRDWKQRVRIELKENGMVAIGSPIDDAVKRTEKSGDK